MNRKSVVFAVVGCLVFLCALAACGTPATTDGKPLYPDNMNAKLALQLREDYVRFLEETSPGENNGDLNNTRVTRYVGNYSGCEIVFMDCGQLYTQALRYADVAGYTITFGNGQEAYAYRDAQFHTLREAYDAGLLTRQDVYDIGLQIDPSFEDKNQPDPD